MPTTSLRKSGSSVSSRARAMARTTVEESGSGAGRLGLESARPAPWHRYLELGQQPVPLDMVHEAGEQVFREQVAIVDALPLFLRERHHQLRLLIESCEIVLHVLASLYLSLEASGV